MRKLFQSLFGISDKSTEQSVARVPAPQTLSAAGAPEPFPFAEHITVQQGYPRVDWEAVRGWVDGIDTEKNRALAWAAAEQAWLWHLRDALGTNYHLVQSGTALVLSPLAPGVAGATLGFMERTLKRVTTVLEGIAEPAEWGAYILVVFETEDQYYDYISHYYPDEGEFAFSSGMFLPQGCAHFVTVKEDMRSVEPVIVHEMTHACLSHLPLPLWLDEGLAVNTEHRLAGAQPSEYTARELLEQHRVFWGVEEIQQFWSGKSFERSDEGNMLSYDLARILVEQFSVDWPRFAAFVRAAHYSDGGASAAQLHLDIRLGESVAALFGKRDGAEFEPSIEAADAEAAAAA